jgi:1,4-alpha-glucan branching enzyme
MLVAEDHTGWDAVTKLPAQGGLGFDATWEVSFYHSLIGDSKMAGDRAHLLRRAGLGGNEPLRMDWFSGDLYGTQYRRVVFHESHDEAGNAEGTARTITVAVNNAPLFGPTRQWAEARARVCFGLSLLSAGTPMFFMGEEAAQKKYVQQFRFPKGGYSGEKRAPARPVQFYQDLLSLNRRLRSIRTQNIDILHQSNENRIIAFKRWTGNEEVIIVASLNNAPFSRATSFKRTCSRFPMGSGKRYSTAMPRSMADKTLGTGSAASLRRRPAQRGPSCERFVVLVRQ